MAKTIIVAAAAMLGGTALGILLCHAAVRRMQKRFHDLQEKLTGKRGGMGVMDKVLLLEVVILILYTITDFIVFWHTGAEPTVLTASVFAACGLENGVMGWIKTNKDKVNEKQEKGADGEPPAG